MTDGQTVVRPWKLPVAGAIVLLAAVVFAASGVFASAGLALVGYIVVGFVWAGIVAYRMLRSDGDLP